MQTDVILNTLNQVRIIPAITLADAKNVGHLADALVAGGLPVAEIMFRSNSAEDSIRAMAQRDDVLVGAGTVLTVEQADKALGAGAKFAVSPGFNASVVGHCQKIGLPIFPGISSPTDIEMALDLGLQVVKFFPAEAFGGVATLKAISGPYPMMRFVPTGGINSGNLRDYLALDSVIACGGSWMVKSSLILDGDFPQIEQLAREAVALAQNS